MPGLGLGLGLRAGAIASGGSWTPAKISSVFEGWVADPAYVTLSSGKVSAMTGVVGGRTLSMSTSASRPTWLASGGIGGAASLSFDGVDDYLVSDDAASTWSFLHNGSGMTVAYVASVLDGPVLSTVLSTCGLGNLAGAGVTIGSYDPQYGLYDLQVMAENVGQRALDVNATGSTTGSRYPVFRYKQSNSPRYTVREHGSQLDSGTTATSPSVSNPTYTLRIGNSDGSYWLKGSLREVWVFNAALGTTDLAALETYLAGRI